MKKAMATKDRDKAGCAPHSEAQRVLTVPIRSHAKVQVESSFNLMKLQEFGAPGEDRMDDEWQAYMNGEVPPEVLLSHVERQCLFGHMTPKKRYR